MSEKKRIAISKFFQPENKVKKGEIYDILDENETQIEIRIKNKKKLVDKNGFHIIHIHDILYDKISFMINESCVLTSVFPAIVNERHYQLEKYGEDGNKHELLTWISLIEQEINEAKKAFFSDGNSRLVLQELLQAITIGIACLENNLTIERDNSSNFNTCYREKDPK